MNVSPTHLPPDAGASGDDVPLAGLPVAAFTLDVAGQLTGCNAAAAALWGSLAIPGPHPLRQPDGTPLPIAPTDPARGRPAVAVRADGSSFPVRIYLGKVAGGFLGIMVDAPTSDAATTIDRERLAAIVASSNDAIISKTLDGIITSWNGGATGIFGYTAADMIGQPITRLVPPELLSEEAEILGRLRHGEKIEPFDTVRVGRDGRRIDISLTISPLRDASGAIVGASKIARDITERKQSDVLQRLLLDELNHRVKNTLATLQAIAGQSLRRAPTPECFVASFNGRVQALARVHDLLVDGRLGGVDVADLVRSQLAPAPHEAAQVTLTGPHAALAPEVAVQLALVLHELASNARRHGALAAAGRRLSVAWDLIAGASGRLRLVWTERGMSDLTAPSAPGFGTTLIERSLDAAGGTTLIRFGADGITCEIDLPLPPLSSISPARTTAPPVEARRQTPSEGLRGRRVLLVEDEALVALDIEAQLEAAGFEVVGPAASIEAARALVDEGAFDAALLDANLGGRSVEDLALTLVERDIPFAFATGYGREGLPARFRDAPLLGKPFSESQLLAVVGTLLAEPRAGARTLG